MKGGVEPAIKFARLAGVLGLVLVGVTGWTLYDTEAKMRTAVRWVVHSEEVLRTIDQTSERHLAAEVAQRAYLLSGLDDMLRVRARALDRTQASIARLAELTADNPLQQQHVRELAARVAERQQKMEEGVRVRRESGLAGALDLIASGAPDRATRQVDGSRQRLETEERRLLAERRAEEERSLLRARLALSGTLCIVLLLLVPGYLGFAREVRHSSELERRLREMAQQLPVAVYRLRRRGSSDWQAEYLSGSCAEVHRVDVEAAHRDLWVVFATVCAEDRPKLLEQLQAPAADGGRFEAEYRIDAEDGPCSRWVRSSANVRVDSDGSVVFNGYWADITAQKALTAEIEAAHREADAANQAKSKFLATMSHEIRTPMNGVMGMLELLDLTRLDGEQRATLAVVRDSGRSLLRLIDDLLDFSKIEAGRLELHPQTASLAKVVDRVRQLHSGAASGKGLLLSCVIDSKLGPAQRFDALRLGQILNNLLSNAIKFTASGGVEVRVDLLDRSAVSEFVRLSVTDSGIGVSSEQQAQLFRPFAQAAGHIAGRYGGSGLGLAICRRLAEMMGGRIDMMSAPGRGTTMSLALELPIADPADLGDDGTDQRQDELTAALAARRVAPPVELAAGDRTMVLVVDDHPINRVVLERQVQTLGYATQTAADGVQGFQQWRSGRFALVLTDCHMPNMDGYEMSRRIRAAEAEDGSSRTPIIACTANALRGEAEVCFAAGMDDFLIKPVALGDLMDRLDRWLPLPDSGWASLDPLGHATGSSDGAPLDHGVLAEISMGDPGAEGEILLDFRRINAEDALQLRHAAAAADTPLVIRLAHRIKGSSRMVGASPLAQVCSAIEKAARAERNEQVLALMEPFQFQLQRLNAYLDALQVRDVRAG